MQATTDQFEFLGLLDQYLIHLAKVQAQTVPQDASNRPEIVELKIKCHVPMDKANAILPATAAFVAFWNAGGVVTSVEVQSDYGPLTFDLLKSATQDQS